MFAFSVAGVTAGFVPMPLEHWEARGIHHLSEQPAAGFGTLTPFGHMQ